jgi:hypothetical protein
MATRQAIFLLRHLRQLTAVHESLSDRELLQRFAQERHEASFTALIERHGPMVWSACIRVLHNRHDAEDVFQAAFLGSLIPKRRSA